MRRGPLFLLAGLAALLSCLPAAAGAESLFDRSLVMFQAKAEHASPADFTFVVLGDSRQNDGIFKKALALAASCNPLFILHGGDYSEKGSDQETGHFLDLVRESVPDIPLFVVFGNHENRKVFSEKIGPLNFSLDSARLKLRLIALDNAGYALMARAQSHLSQELAEKRESTFVAMHIPPRTYRWSWHTFTDGADELVNTLAANRVKAAFYFHIHLYEQDEIKGVPSIIAAGAGAPLVRFGFPGEPVYHIVAVRVNNGEVSVQRISIRE